MSEPSSSPIYAAIAVAGLLLTATAWTETATGDEDWPWYRGPDRNAVARATGLLQDWPPQGPPELWRIPLGAGFSSIAVADGRAFALFGADGDTWLRALRARTGEEIWTTRVDDMYRNGQGDGPRSTPAVIDGRVFALSGRGTLIAVDADAGVTIWRRDLRRDFDAGGPTWGFASSPVPHGDRILLEVGGDAGIVSLDAATGSEVWRSQRDRAGYSTPVLTRVGGQEVAVFFTGEHVLGLDPADGRGLWRIPWETSFGVNAADPVLVPPDRVFVSSGYDVGSALLRISPDEVEVLWRSREMKNQFSSSLYRDGFLYGFDNSILECIDIASGERTWRVRGFGHGSLLYADGKLIVLGDDGDLALVQADPGEYREIARVTPLRGRAWTMPSLADGILYVRNERQLVALDLRDHGVPGTTDFEDHDPSSPRHE